MNCENCNPEALDLIFALQFQVDLYNNLAHLLSDHWFGLRKPSYYLPDHAPFRAPR